jgi:hypothetical protein
MGMGSHPLPGALRGMSKMSMGNPGRVRPAPPVVPQVPQKWPENEEIPQEKEPIGKVR